ncbi:hypothetical protein ACF1AY_38620 [Streptomyces sp. NPDC014776]
MTHDLCGQTLRPHGVAFVRTNPVKCLDDSSGGHSEKQQSERERD